MAVLINMTGSTRSADQGRACHWLRHRVKDELVKGQIAGYIRVLRNRHPGIQFGRHCGKHLGYSCVENLIFDHFSGVILVLSKAFACDWTI